MNKMQKLFPVFAALAAVIIVAGAILYGLLGFNRASVKIKTVEIGYNAITATAEEENALAKECENAFSAQNLKFTEKSVSIQRDSNSLGETGDKLLTYTFSAKASDEALRNAANAIKNISVYEDADIYVTVHLREDTRFIEAAWRGAIALAVAAIVTLGYVAFRYGFANAITGLAAVCCSTLATLGLFAIARIPVYAYAPLLFAGLAAVFTVLLWITRCAKMKEHFKDPSFAALTPAEAVSESFRMSNKLTLWIVVAFAAVFVVLGAVAAAGARLFLLPALLPLAVSVYTTMLLAPTLLVPLKKKFDRLKSNRKRYVGKKKANAEE